MTNEELLTAVNTTQCPNCWLWDEPMAAREELKRLVVDLISLAEQRQQHILELEKTCAELQEKLYQSRA